MGVSPVGEGTRKARPGSSHHGSCPQRPALQQDTGVGKHRRAADRSYRSPILPSPLATYTHKQVADDEQVSNKVVLEMHRSRDKPALLGAGVVLIVFLRIGDVPKLPLVAKRLGCDCSTATSFTRQGVRTMGYEFERSACEHLMSLVRIGYILSLTRRGQVGVFCLCMHHLLDLAHGQTGPQLVHHSVVAFVVLILRMAFGDPGVSAAYQVNLDVASTCCQWMCRPIARPWYFMVYLLVGILNNLSLGRPRSGTPRIPVMDTLVSHCQFLVFPNGGSTNVVGC